MEIYMKDGGSPVSTNAEWSDQGSPQPHPEKPQADSFEADAMREATRRYVERVDRYLARPEVMRAGSHAAPSFSSVN